MWDILNAYDLVSLYAFAFLAPFSLGYLVMRLVGFLRGL